MVHADHVLVLAIAHHRRRPVYWTDRLGDWTWPVATAGGRWQTANWAQLPYPKAQLQMVRDVLRRLGTPKTETSMA